jgi:hypothetical protein
MANGGWNDKFWHRRRKNRFENPVLVLQATAFQAALQSISLLGIAVITRERS